jgi:hypothetical protein
MKIGDLVRPREGWMTEGLDYGIGIILDTYEDDDGMRYFEVQWNHECQWWKPYEMKVISESR